MMRVHYGTPNGLACGAHFSHTGITVYRDFRYVTCLRCKATREYFAAVLGYPPADVETHES